jgi:hypothetical protein
MHRNAEIWEKRHERLGLLKAKAREHFAMAQKARGFDTAAMANGWSQWLERWVRLELRVWHALCVAKGWRKA